MEHDHGCEYQVKVLNQDGTEAESEWIKQECIEQMVVALRKPQGKAWLRERSMSCPLCEGKEKAVAEYPLTESPSLRNTPHDSDYLLSTGAKDPLAIPGKAHRKASGR